MQKHSLLGPAVAALVLIAGAAGQAQNYSNAVLALNPVAYWPLSETAPPPAGEYTATNSGTLGAVGNGYYATWWQAPGSSQALVNTNVIQHAAGVTKDGDTALQDSVVGQNVVIPRFTNGVANAAVSLVPPFSIEFWAYPTNVGGSLRPLVNQGFNNINNGAALGNQTVQEGFGIGAYNANYYFACFNGAGTKTEADNNNLVVANQWQHVVGTFDGTVISLYVNGKKVTATLTTRNALGQLYVPDAISPLLIGAGGGENNPFGGIIDEVAVYTNLLSAQTVTNHFYAQSTNSPANYYATTVRGDNPIIYLRLNEPAFAGAPDPATYPVANNYGSVGSAAAGRYQPGTAPGVAGPAYSGFGSPSYAVALNGFNSAVDVGAGVISVQLNPTGNQPVTVTAWFKGNPADCVARFQTLVGHSDASWRLSLDTLAGNRFNPGAGPELQFGSVSEELSKGMYLNDGNWHFAAGVSDGTNDYLYLDGVLVKSGTGVGSIPGSLQDVMLGGDPQYTTPQSSGAVGRFFEGSLAQVAVFSNALTAAQVQGIYSAAGNIPPSVRLQPTSQAVFAGQPVTLTTTVSGANPLGYQWYLSGSPVSGQTGASLSFSPATGHAGSYFLVATNPYGSVTSVVAQISVGNTPSSFATAVEALNPVAYWPLDETTQPPFGAYLATNLGTAGLAGNGYYETWFQPLTVGLTNTFYQTNSIQHVPGAIAGSDLAMSCARNASGSGQYVIFPRSTNGVANPALNLIPPFSIEFWVFPNSNNASVMPIINQGRNPVLDPRSGYTNVNWDGFCIGQYANNFFFAAFAGTGSDSSKQELDTSITLSNWQHLVLTFDGTNQAWFKNGVAAGSRTIPNSAANAFGQLYMPDLVSPLLIGTGCEPSAGNSGTEYPGVIDEVAIYTNVLDPSLIANHFNAAAVDDTTYKTTVLNDNPVIYVRLDEPAFSSSAYPNPSLYPVAYNYGLAGGTANGRYQPGTVAGVRGPAYGGLGGSRAVAFNGHSGAVDVGGGFIPAQLNPTGTQPLTVAVWFQANPADAPARFQNIVGHGNSSWRITMDNVTGALRFNPGNGPELQFTNTSEVIASNAVANDGQWHFVAGVSDGSTASLYLDGLLIKTGTGVGSLGGSTIDAFLGGDPASTVVNYNTANTLRYFDGQVAQVAFFTNALTVAQLSALYGAAGVPPTIAQQPLATVNANSGQTVVVPVNVKGSAPLVYQWYRSGGTRVAGQTIAALTFNPVALANSGSYYAVITNAYGAVTSTIVQLNVVGPPVVQQQSPANVRVFVGTAPVLRVSATGPAPLSYQWSQDGGPIAGATASSYLPSTASVGVHTYTCAITNAYSAGSPTAISPISVAVLAAPVAPYPKTVLGDHPLYYYRLNESPDDGMGNNGVVAYDYAGGLNAAYTNVSIAQPGYDSLFSPQTDPNETGASFGTLSPVDSYAGNVPSYLTFATSNGTSGAFSVEAWVYSGATPAAGAGLVALGYGNGGEQFCLDTGGGNNHAFRFYVRNSAAAAAVANSAIVPNDGLWHHVVGTCDQANGRVVLYVDGTQSASVAIAPNTGLLSASVPLSIGSRQSGNGTPYDSQFAGSIDEVALYGYALNADQVLAHYTNAGVPPLFVVQPSDVTTNEGTTVTLTALAIGSPPLTYQWYDNNGALITGATGPTLVLATVRPDQAGSYHPTASNPYAFTPVLGGYAQLTINSGPPTLVADLAPLFHVGYAGQLFTYSVSVSGTAPFSYLWTRNGLPVPGATSSSYTFPTLLGTNLYAVTVTNNDTAIFGTGPTISSTATNVGVPALTLNPQNYTYKMKISFPGYNRGEALANFPALVTFGTNLPGFAYGQLASAAGGDLRFTDATGTNETPHELDEWNPNGQSSVWVQVPKLATTNDYIWAYWGNPAATVPEAWSTNGGVWVPAFGAPAPFDVVYHLKESAFPFADSTLQYPALTGSAPTPTPAIVGTGGVFSSSYLDAGVMTNLDDQFSVSAWLNVSTAADSIQSVWASKAGGNSSGFGLFINTYQTHDQKLILETGNGNNSTPTLATPAGAISYGQWHLVTAVVDRSVPGARLFVDGVDANATGSVRPDFANNIDVNLGRLAGGAFPFNGIIDEARIQSGTNSANWVWASYQTVAQNSSFENYSAISSSLVRLDFRIVGGQLVLTWPQGTLQSASQVTGQYSDLGTATSPYTNVLSGTQYYRVRVR